MNLQERHRGRQKKATAEKSAEKMEKKVENEAEKAENAAAAQRRDDIESALRLFAGIYFLFYLLPFLLFFLFLLSSFFFLLLSSSVFSLFVIMVHSLNLNQTNIRLWKLNSRYFCP